MAFTAIIGFIGLPKYFLWRMLIWILSGLISYILIVPWFNYKEKKFIDFAPLGFAFIIVAAISLAKVEDPSNSGYFQLFIVLSSVPFLGGWVKSIKDGFDILSFSKVNPDLLKDFSDDEKINISKIYKSFSKIKEFTAIEASKVVSINEKKTRILLKKMEEYNLVESFKKANAVSYKFLEK